MKRVEREERDDDPLIQVVTPSAFQEMRRLARRWETSARRGGTLPTTPLLLFLMLLAATGLRAGEVLALRWTDLTLDGDSPTLYVTGTLKKLKGRPVFRQPVPKSKKSVRAIALAPDLVAALEDHRALQKSQGISHPERAVFATSTGTWMAYRNVLRAWRAAFGGTSVGEYSPKALRSTVLTNLLNLGMHREAQAQAGHSSLRITERYYDGGLPKAPATAHVMQLFLTAAASE
jgi:integrase